uniref:Uncharacterized protein n=1 Tax=Arundo donax TaxID=35708 RepID=A0A0A9ANL2_ARUDO
MNPQNQGRSRRSRRKRP